VSADLVSQIRGKLLSFWIGEHAEVEARDLLSKAADEMVQLGVYVEDILTKDRLKTREINILTAENRELLGEIERLRNLLAKIGVAYCNTHGTEWQEGCRGCSEAERLTDDVPAEPKCICAPIGGGVVANPYCPAHFTRFG
jgi:hypothetical protein